MRIAFLLISHGSRDPRPQIAARELARLVAQELDSGQPSLALCQNSSSGASLPLPPAPPLAATAALELAPISLHQSIEQFALRAKTAGFAEVQLVPLFLHEGVHVREDIPAAVERARSLLGAKIALNLHPHLGSSTQLLPLLAAQFEELNSSRRILLAHGSRRPGGNEAIAALASQLNARAAYWSIAPSLSDRLATCREGESIAIVPYFLFPGGITATIADRVRAWQKQHPNTPLQLGQPLGATPELASAIAARMQP